MGPLTSKINSALDSKTGAWWLGGGEGGDAHSGDRTIWPQIHGREGEAIHRSVSSDQGNSVVN